MCIRDRNLASIVEVAAINNRNRKMGHNLSLIHILSEEEASAIKTVGDLVRFLQNKID